VNRKSASRTLSAFNKPPVRTQFLLSHAIGHQMIGQSGLPHTLHQNSVYDSPDRGEGDHRRGRRKPTDAFCGLQSHYLFAAGGPSQTNLGGERDVIVGSAYGAGACGNSALCVKRPDSPARFKSRRSEPSAT
jgi:hypothetical protein